VVVWSPLGGGFLSGKYEPGETKRAGARSTEGWAFPIRYFALNRDEILAALLEVANGLGRSPAQVALRWVLDQSFITSVIPGARTAEQLRDNLRACGWRMPANAREKLDKVSALPHRYPRSMEDTMHERRDSAVKMPNLPD
jgi:aryl-alcohol dehydrogenase-like predicted oxidoreductase